MSSEDTRGEEALAFLATQLLAPTPQNYTLAYLALNQPDSQIARAVRAMADDGLRIRQQEADEIVALYAKDALAVAPDASEAERRALQKQASKLSEMTASAAAASHDFARDLDAEAKGLDNEAARTVQLVARMIARSKRAEDSFRFALEEIDTLRQELENAREEAERDPLTNLPNRRSIERHLQHLASSGVVRTIGLCDIDHFKSFNDRYGHAVGDRILKMIASTLAAGCAPHFVGRWGGEEFLVVIAGDELDRCVELLENVRQDLAGRNFKQRETDEPLGRITFSAGVATAVGDHSQNYAAIHRADASMYEAKAAGRNRVLAS
jgi:diguanylate cyclase